ncbi:MAG TPA: glycosyltransferase [Polyangia bacterium]|nr:glycosyltransferase [Polyangia bacterium]
MRIWVLGFPHTQTLDPRDESIVNMCPFTEQVWYFCKMMVDRGHDVTHIGMPGSNPPGGCEHVDAMTEDWWRILYAWKKPEAPFILTRENAYGQQWTLYEENVRKILLERGGDPYTSIVACLWGHNGCVKDIPQIVVECGIGSPSAFAAFRIYLSQGWRHFHEGQDNNFGGDKWFRQVIPLGINMDMFGPVIPTAQKDNFFLVQTRMLEPKGVRIAVQVARELNTPIVLTGRGDASSFVAEWPEGTIAPGISSTGVRRDLMRRAKALLSPTRYVEPLGAVALEAMASGCPVVSTDLGGYCVPVEAKILTKRGWLAKSEVQVGLDETLGYDPATCQTQWTIITQIHSFSNRPTTEYYNRNWKVRVTSEHRWSAIHGHRHKETIASIEQLCRDTRNRIRLAAPACDGDLNTSPEQAALIAWLLTDGSIETRMVKGKRHAFNPEQDAPDSVSAARIWQSKPAGLQAIRRDLRNIPHSECGRKPRPRILPQRVFRVRARYVREAFASAQIISRGLTGFVLGLKAEARKAFLRVCIDAEGSKASSSSTILLSQNAGPLYEAMCLCVYLCGRRPTRSRNGIRNRVVALSNAMVAPSRLHKGGNRIEDVWCPSTILGTWTMLFDEHIVLTGNCDTVVDGYTGYRCNTFQEFVRAAKHVDKIDPNVCREWVAKNNSLAVVGERYERYFESILRLKERKTWVDPGPEGSTDEPPRPRFDYSMLGAGKP